MSQVVSKQFYSLRKLKVLSALFWFLCVLFPLSLKGAENPPFLLAYTQVRKPSLLIPRAGVSLPQEFSKYPFSVYHAFSSHNSTGLESVVVVPKDASGVWTSLAKKRSWVSVEMNNFVLFIKEESDLLESTALHSRIAEHLRFSPSSVASGGLMNDWGSFLAYAQNSVDLKAAALEAVLPLNKNQVAMFGEFSHWLLDELSNIQTLVWEVDPTQKAGPFAISITAKQGSRLSRLFTVATGARSKVFGFVPKETSNLNLGSLHSINANNYFNHFFRGTKGLESESYAAVRNQLNALDPGIFDRWDGSWAVWNPNGGDERLLLLGGRFQAADLSELFEVLGEVPFSGMSGQLILDEQNSVVGFTRVRSLEWVDEGEETLLGRLLPKPIYIGVSNGFVAISESDTALMELVFTLNSRRPLRESALQLLEEETNQSVLQYVDDKLIHSLAMRNGRLVLRQPTPPSWFYSYFAKMTKNLSD
jgi:hypothetical protein